MNAGCKRERDRQRQIERGRERERERRRERETKMNKYTCLKFQIKTVRTYLDDDSIEQSQELNQLEEAIRFRNYLDLS